MGPCAKRVVSCEIEVVDVFCGVHRFIGRNDCENPQPVCPRLPGEGYEKCKTVCRQQGHAELQALRKFNVWVAQHPGDLEHAYNVRATVKGHTYICRDCQEAMYASGLKWLRVEQPDINERKT